MKKKNQPVQVFRPNNLHLTEQNTRPTQTQTHGHLTNERMPKNRRPMPNSHADNRAQYTQSFYQPLWHLETFIRTTWSQLAEDWLGYHSSSPPLLKSLGHQLSAKISKLKIWWKQERQYHKVTFYLQLRWSWKSWMLAVCSKNNISQHWGDATVKKSSLLLHF